MRMPTFRTSSLGLVLLASIQAYVLVRRDALAESFRTYRVGDQLPNIRVGELPAPNGLRRFVGRTHDLRDLGAGQCTVLVFFQSTCEFSENWAPQWQLRRLLRTDSGEASIHWIATSPHDTAALSFLKSHLLPLPGYFIKTDEDLLKSGVSGTPTIYVVGRRGRILRMTGRLQGLKQLPAECGPLPKWR